MSARMTNPGTVLPEATKAIHDLIRASFSGGVGLSTMELVHLRTSQVNGCSYCVAQTAQKAKEAGRLDERLVAVAAWRDTPWFDDAERAALALAEAMARLSDRSNAVPDDVWDEAARYYDERQLAGLVLWIATCNLFNRVNVTTRQPVGQAARD
jgi:AhpD family alkylhydroperoxidase